MLGAKGDRPRISFTARAEPGRSPARRSPGRGGGPQAALPNLFLKWPDHALVDGVTLVVDDLSSPKAVERLDLFGDERPDPVQLGRKLGLDIEAWPWSLRAVGRGRALDHCIVNYPPMEKGRAGAGESIVATVQVNGAAGAPETRRCPPSDPRPPPVPPPTGSRTPPDADRRRRRRRSSPCWPVGP